MSLVRSAAQISAEIDLAGGEPDRALSPASGARARALCQLAREYPDRFQELYEAEMAASGAETRRTARARVAPLVDRIRELAAKKLTDAEIAAALGVPRTTVGSLRRANGIAPGLGRVGRPGGVR
jgi:hypothetical protein